MERVVSWLRGQAKAVRQADAKWRQGWDRRAEAARASQAQQLSLRQSTLRWYQATVRAACGLVYQEEAVSRWRHGVLSRGLGWWRSRRDTLHLRGKRLPTEAGKGIVASVGRLHGLKARLQGVVQREEKEGTSQLERGGSSRRAVTVGQADRLRGIRKRLAGAVLPKPWLAMPDEPDPTRKKKTRGKKESRLGSINRKLLANGLPAQPQLSKKGTPTLTASLRLSVFAPQPTSEVGGSKQDRLRAINERLSGALLHLPTPPDEAEDKEVAVSPERPQPPLGIVGSPEQA